MSARLVAVTTLLLDVLGTLYEADNLTPAERDLLALLGPKTLALGLIKVRAITEMQALAPAVLAADQMHLTVMA